MMNAQDFSLTRTKEKPIGLIGSSYHSQEALNKTIVDDPILLKYLAFSLSVTGIKENSISM